MKTVDRGKLSNLRMVAGNEKKYRIVVCDGKVKEWVGFGWIDLRDATVEDEDKYPVAVES